VITTVAALVKDQILLDDVFATKPVIEINPRSRSIVENVVGNGRLRALCLEPHRGLELKYSKFMRDVVADGRPPRLLSRSAVPIHRSVPPPRHRAVTNPNELVRVNHHITRVPRKEDAIAINAFEQVLLNRDILRTFHENRTPTVQRPITTARDTPRLHEGFRRVSEANAADRNVLNWLRHTAPDADQLLVLGRDVGLRWRTAAVRTGVVQDQVELARLRVEEPLVRGIELLTNVLNVEAWVRVDRTTRSIDLPTSTALPSTLRH
tara:strand:- start:1480 stop:2274 length:795 start_codon:yes stop_codon:yes gene_type:complete